MFSRVKSFYRRLRARVVLRWDQFIFKRAFGSLSRLMDSGYIGDVYFFELILRSNRLEFEIPIEVLRSIEDYHARRLGLAPVEKPQVHYIEQAEPNELPVESTSL